MNATLSFDPFDPYDPFDLFDLYDFPQILAGILFPLYAYMGYKTVIIIILTFLSLVLLKVYSGKRHALPLSPVPETVRTAGDDSIFQYTPKTLTPGKTIETGTTEPAELLHYAKSLIGVPYLYACTDPAKGFDCSGFVTHVFNHFNIAVPRSSIDFTNVGKEIDYHKSGPGDLILFTGTDSTKREVGHMGIVFKNENDSLQFIHSTSGNAKGVVITNFERYYKGRFVKVIRIFPERFFE